MKRSILRNACRVMYIAATVALIAIGCGDNGIQDKSSKVGDFVNMFANGGNNVDTVPANNAAYTLTVNISPAEGGTVSRNIEQSSYKAGTSVTVTATPHSGYTFLGWSGALNSTETEVKITMDGDRWLSAGFLKEGSDLTVYDVYFNANGATGGAPSSARTVSGNSITLPDQASMEKTGYNFAGWSEDKFGAGTRYAANSIYTVTHGVTLYAKWLPIYTVTFNANNATSGSAVAAVTADSGMAIKLPGQGNISRGGYSFGGWSTSSSGSGDDYGAGASYTVTGNVTLYVRWNEVNSLPEYSVVYDGNGNTGGNTANLAIKYKQNSVINLRGKGDLAKEGYSFNGWCINPSCAGTSYTEGSSYTVTSDVTFYAKWVALSVCTVTFDDNGATNGIAPAIVETYSGNSITLSGQGNMEKAGHSFGGWNTNADGTGTNYAAYSSYTVTRNVTLYAKWTVVKMFTVTFDGNNHTDGAVPSSMSQDSGKTIMLPSQESMERGGYNFGGWNTNASGTGTGYAAGSSYTVTKDITLFAKWTTMAAYTVKFSTNGATSGNPPADEKAYSGSTITIPDQGNLERNNYRFGGWNTSSGGTGTNYDAGSSYTVNGNVTLYAKWTAIAYYTVKFSGNGNTSGTEPPAMSNQESGTTITLPDQGNLEKNGNSFGGWSMNSSGTGTIYPAYSNYTVTGNVAFYAKWTAIMYTLTVEKNPMNGGTVNPSSQSGITGGKSVNILATPAKDYRFTGWTLTSGNGNILRPDSTATSVIVNGDVIVTANFEQNQPTQYYVTVVSAGTGASGSGNYGVGQTVTISAGTAPSGQKFKNWTSAEGIYLSNANSATTTFTMIGKPVTVTAVFEQQPIESNKCGTNGTAGSCKTVTIGGRTWMTENLNYKTSNGSWCYDNDESNCNKYGRLYDWNTARTVCPAGWHLSSRDDWDHLAESVGGRKDPDSWVDSENWSHNWLDMDKKLKAKSGWNENGNGMDNYGFSALPGGGFRLGGHGDIFGDVGTSATWWTATDGGIIINGVSSYAYCRSMYYSYPGDGLWESRYDKEYGLSVRCVQN